MGIVQNQTNSFVRPLLMSIKASRNRSALIILTIILHFLDIKFYYKGMRSLENFEVYEGYMLCNGS